MCSMDLHHIQYDLVIGYVGVEHVTMFKHIQFDLIVYCYTYYI